MRLRSTDDIGKLLPITSIHLWNYDFKAIHPNWHHTLNRNSTPN